MKWRKGTLRDITEVVTKGTTPTTFGKDFTEEGVTFVKAEALNGDSALDAKGFAFVDEATNELLRRSILEEEDVLLTIAGAQTGKCGFVRREHLPANCNQAVGIIRVNQAKASARFVYYFFKQPATFSFVQSLSAQAAQPNLNLTRLREIEIPLPLKEEQEAITAVLSGYDELIINNERRMALLERGARLLYEEWFVHLRFPGREHTRIRDGVPDGWAKRVLEEICPDVREAADPNELEPDTPYIGLEHIPRRSVSLGTWGCAADVTSTKLRYRVGDILFGKIRPYFHKVGIAFTDGVTSSDAIVLRPVQDVFLPLALMTVSSDWFVAEVSQTAREGSKMPRADWKLMEKRPVIIPRPSVLGAFNDLIGPILQQLRTLTFCSRKLREARDLLLPRLMSGEIAV